MAYTTVCAIFFMGVLDLSKVFKEICHVDKSLPDGSSRVLWCCNRIQVRDNYYPHLKKSI